MRHTEKRKRIPEWMTPIRLGLKSKRSKVEDMSRTVAVGRRKETRFVDLFVRLDMGL